MSHLEEFLCLNDTISSLLDEPYYLKSSYDKTRKDLVMLYPTFKSDMDNAIVQECNGVVIDFKMHKIVCFGMSSLKEIDDIPESAETAELAEDGTVLRVWWYKSEWMVSTSKRIDARHAKWSSDKSFYELLLTVVKNPEEDFNKSLDKDYTFSFILLHPENQLVVYHPNPELVLVSRKSLVTKDEERCEDSFPFCRLPTTVSSFTEEDSRHRGWVFTDWSNPKAVLRTKKDYSWFKTANSLRKNFPTVGLSYLAANYHEKNVLRSFFPEKEPTFNSMDYWLGVIAGYIHNSYQNSFVKKLYQIPDSHPMYPIIRRIHRNYKQTGTPTTFTGTCSVVYTSNPWILQQIMFEISQFSPSPQFLQGY